MKSSVVPAATAGAGFLGAFAGAFGDRLQRFGDVAQDVRVAVERGQDPSKILQDCSLGQIAILSRAANVNGVLQQKGVRLLASSVIQHAGRVIDLRQQAFGSIEMVRDGGICWLSRQWSVTIDSNVAFYFAAAMELQAKYC